MRRTTKRRQCKGRRSPNRQANCSCHSLGSLPQEEYRNRQGKTSWRRSNRSDPSPCTGAEGEISNQGRKTRKGAGHVLDSSPDRAEDNSEVQHAWLRPLMCDLSPECDSVVFIQLFDLLKCGRVLSDESTLLEERKDVCQFFLLRRLLVIAQELSPRDPN